MDKQTLSNYGWVIVVVLVLAVMLGLATPFGKYVGVGIGNIAKAYKEASNADAIDKNVDTMRDEWNSFFGNETTPKFGDGKIEYGKNDPDLNHKDVIPAGGKYYADGITHCGVCSYVFTDTPFTCHCGKYTNMPKGSPLTAGDTFPVSQNNDIYEYGDYEYCFWDGQWQASLNSDVTDRQQKKYGELLETINNVPLGQARYLYSGCGNLIEAPILPNTVTDFRGGFESCKSLTDLSDYKLPDGLMYAETLFLFCTNLTKAPDVPDSVIDCGGMFFGCASLTEEPYVPNHLQDRKDSMFNGCVLLGYPAIP